MRYLYEKTFILPDYGPVHLPMLALLTAADVSHTANSNTQLMFLYETNERANEWTKNINVETSSYMEWTQKNKIFCASALTLVCFMGHKLLAFRLRTAFFEAFLLDYFHWSARKCFYMKNWNLYFIFHHEKYCWMDFYKYAFCFCCFASSGAVFLRLFLPLPVHHQRLLKFFFYSFYFFERDFFVNFCAIFLPTLTFILFFFFACFTEYLKLMFWLFGFSIYGIVWE